MNLGQEIEKIRQQRNIPVWQLCDVLNIDNEQEYHKIINGHIKLSVYQMVMLIEFFKCSFDKI